MSVRIRLSFAGAFLGALAMSAATGAARAETRALNLFNTHTQERATIVFKRDGAYDQSGLDELNRMLRDWRRNEVTKMDPALFDLIYEVYRDSGAEQPIHIVCGYRSPATNNMLRSRSRGVAKFSQHMLGKAMDFYLPDVPLDKLRAVGMKKQIGGVGFYPTSGSPFVHMDTGNVRAWPRMTREQLVRLFPDGKTLHLPSDGGPLPRYEEALAEYQSKRGRSGSTAVAFKTDDNGIVRPTGGSGGNILASLFGGFGGSSNSNAAPGDDEDETPAPRKPQELRQGPPPPGSRSVASAAGSDDDAAGPAAPAIALPPPPPPRVSVAALAPQAQPPAPMQAAQAPTAQAPTAQVPTTQAPGSLVALPASAAAPRAPGSLLAPMNRAQLPEQPPLPAVAAPVPPGWIQGPQGAPVPAGKPTVTASLQPVNAAVPAAKPGLGKADRSAAAAEAISILTGGGQQAAVSANALGYAAVPAAKPSDLDPRVMPGAPVTRSAGGIVVAALPPGTVPTNTANDATRLTGILPTAKPAPKGDRADPLARLVGHVSDKLDPRLLDVTKSTRTAAYALFQHPDQEGLPQLLVKPGTLVISGFGPSAGAELRADRFAGPAVTALVVVKTD